MKDPSDKLIEVNLGQFECVKENIEFIESVAWLSSIQVTTVNFNGLPE